MAQRLVTAGKSLSNFFVTKSQGAVRTASPHLKTFWGHARRELGPPAPGQWPEIKRGFNHLYRSGSSGAFMELTVKEGFRNFIVFVEVSCWFFIGEVIGRRSLIGYDLGERIGEEFPPKM